MRYISSPIITSPLINMAVCEFELSFYKHIHSNDANRKACAILGDNYFIILKPFP
ncbi:hypothetical protein BH10BAC3_BH10BAC3_06430 [soil metagenome]